MPPSEQADSEYQEIFDDESDGSLVFISWASNCSRSDNIARELGGKSYMVYHPIWGSNFFTIAFKYLTQSIETFWILLRDRPRRVLSLIHI